MNTMLTMAGETQKFLSAKGGEYPMKLFLFKDVDSQLNLSNIREYYVILQHNSTDGSQMSPPYFSIYMRYNLHALLFQDMGIATFFINEYIFPSLMESQRSCLSYEPLPLKYVKENAINSLILFDSMRYYSTDLKSNEYVPLITMCQRDMIMD